MSVEILLSTYNGEKYIRAFLDSLSAQTMLDFSLIVRDDGSTDETLSIIEDYRSEFNKKIRIIGGLTNNLGPARSFGVLLQESTADYILFADQDDVWLPTKIERLHDEILRQELLHPGVPILLQSDLEVVDEVLNSIAPSFWAFQGLNPLRNSLANLLMQNIVTGCAVILNRSLVLRMKKMPDSAIMHDWWAALVAAAFGHVISIPVPLIQYRQHGANSVGAKKYGLAYLFRRAAQVMSNMRLEQFKRSLKFSRLQAQAFLEEYDSSLSQEQKNLLRNYVSLSSRSWFGRRCFLIKNDMLKHGFGRNMGLLLSI